MILVIGGAGQGKLAAALRNTGYTEADVTTTPGADRPVLNGMADAVRSALAAGEAQEQTAAWFQWNNLNGNGARTWGGSAALLRKNQM